MRKIYDKENSCDKPLEDAIIIGHTNKSSVRIWVRSEYQGKHYVVLSKRPFEPESLNLSGPNIEQKLRNLFGKDIKIKSEKLSFDTDNTAVLTFNNLSSGTIYYVGLVADPSTHSRNQWRCGFDVPAKFKTFGKKRADSAPIDYLSFGFFSCHDPFYDGRNSTVIFREMKDALDEAEGSFVIAGGDQVYVDSSVEQDDLWVWLSNNKNHFKQYGDDLEGIVKELQLYYRKIYRKYWGFVDLQLLFRSFPTYMIWDDHEIMDGWGSLTDDELSDKLDRWFEWENKDFNLFLAKAMFEAAKRTYNEYQHNHNPRTNENQWDYGIDHDIAAIYVLDMRGHHKYKSDSGYDLLGDKQFKRFKKWVESQATKKSVLFIVSPVPIVHWSSTIVNAADHGSFKDDFRDEWDHEENAFERNELLNIVFEASNSSEIPIIFLSGDVHCAASFRLTRASHPKAQIYQFTCSGVTRKPAPFAMRLISKKRGMLANEPEGINTEFFRYSFITRNNFGLITVKIIDDKASVIGKQISTTDDVNELIIKKVLLSRQ